MIKQKKNTLVEKYNLKKGDIIATNANSAYIEDRVIIGKIKKINDNSFYLELTNNKNSNWTVRNNNMKATIIHLKSLASSLNLLSSFSQKDSYDNYVLPKNIRSIDNISDIYIDNKRNDSSTRVAKSKPVKEKPTTIEDLPF